MKRRTALSWSRYHVQLGRSAFSRHLVKSGKKLSKHMMTNQSTATRITFSLDFASGTLSVARLLLLLLNRSSRLFGWCARATTEQHR